MLGIERVFFFSGADASDDGYTIGRDGAIEPFAVDLRQRDSPRQRAMRLRRVIVVNDIATEPSVNERIRDTYHVGAGLFLRTFSTLSNVRLGFEPDPILIVSANAKRSTIDPAQRAALYERLREAAASVPGVTRYPRAERTGRDPLRPGRPRRSSR